MAGPSRPSGGSGGGPAAGATSRKLTTPSSSATHRTASHQPSGARTGGPCRRGASGRRCGRGARAGTTGRAAGGGRAPRQDSGAPAHGAARGSGGRRGSSVRGAVGRRRPVGVGGGVVGGRRPSASASRRGASMPCVGVASAASRRRASLGGVERLGSVLGAAPSRPSTAASASSASASAWRLATSASSSSRRISRWTSGSGGASAWASAGVGRLVGVLAADPRQEPACAACGRRLRRATIAVVDGGHAGHARARRRTRGWRRTTGRSRSPASTLAEHQGQTAAVGAIRRGRLIDHGANPTASGPRFDGPSVRGRRRTRRSLPLDRRRRLRADVVDDAVDARDLVDDARRDLAEDVVRAASPSRRSCRPRWSPPGWRRRWRTSGRRP